MNLDVAPASGSIEQRLVMAAAPRQRLTVLREGIAELSRMAPAASLPLVEDGIRLATSLRDLDAAADLLRLRGSCRAAAGDHAGAATDLARALELLSDRNRSADAVAVAIALGNARAATADHRGAASAFATAIELAGMHAIRDAEADALASRGDFRTALGDYTGGLQDHLATLSLREMLGDIDGTGTALLAVGVIYTLTDDIDRAQDCFDRSAEAFRASGNRYQEVKALTNIAAIHLRRLEPKRALEHALKAQAIYELLGDAANLGRVTAMIGQIHAQQGRPDMALELQLRAYSLLEDSPDDEGRIAILLDIGRLHAAKGADTEAIFVFDQALRMAREIGLRSLQLELHHAISDLYVKLDKPYQAIEHLRSSMALKEEVAGMEKQKAIAELQVRYDIEKAEREREIYRLQAEHLEAEMRLKQNELTAMALNLVQKKKLLDELSSELESLRTTRSRASSMAIEPLIRKIRVGGNDDDDWKRFEEQLDHLHQDFIRTLSERFPSLTPAQLKICSLIRIDLSTKDIANLLFTSVRTVDAHKYNIRKKLGLSSRTSLTTFLAGLTTPTDG